MRGGSRSALNKPSVSRALQGSGESGQNTSSTPPAPWWLKIHRASISIPSLIVYDGLGCQAGCIYIKYRNVQAAGRSVAGSFVHPTNLERVLNGVMYSHDWR